MRSHSVAFAAIGTSWTIDTDRKLTTAEWDAIRQRIEDFDRTYSRFRDDSLVAKVAQAAGTFDFPADVLPLISFYRRLFDLTAGVVTPLVGGVLEHLGYGSDYRLRPAAGDVDTPDWDDVMIWHGTELTTTRPVVLDFGAAGKGYLVDILSAMLEAFGIRSSVVDGSGDLAHSGPDEFRVGLEHPCDPSKVIGVVRMADTALAASAVNRRSWGPGLHHVIDPRDGRPTATFIASWVTADSAMVADGIATAIFFTDRATLAALESEFGIGWLRVSATGTAHWSTNFPGELFR